MELFRNFCSKFWQNDEINVFYAFKYFWEYRRNGRIQNRSNNIFVSFLAFIWRYHLLKVFMCKSSPCFFIIFFKSTYVVIEEGEIKKELLKKNYLKEIGWELRRLKMANVFITIRFLCKCYLAHFTYFIVNMTISFLASFMTPLQMVSNVILVFWRRWTIRCTTSIYLYWCIKLNWPQSILGTMSFWFSCLLRFDVVENFLSQFTLLRGTRILLKAKIIFSGSQKQTKD